jgi:ABC-2 type transport system permease protein
MQRTKSRSATVNDVKVPLDSLTALERVQSGKNSAALIVPSDFSEGLKAGEVRALILEDPRDPLTAGLVVGLLEKESFSLFPALMPMALMKSQSIDSSVNKAFNDDLKQSLSKHFGYSFSESLTSLSYGLFPEEMILGKDTKNSADASGFSMNQAMDKTILIKREQVTGKEVVNPGIAQSVAGPAVLFLLFGVGAIAASLLREMHTGLTQRILMSGVSASELLFSKFFYAVVLGSLQLSVMMIYGRLIFGLQIFDHSAALALIIFVTAMVTSALGLIISAFARTEEQAAGMQTVVILSISAVGGAMFPSFLMPKIINSIAMITPVYWAMQGFTDVFWRNQGVGGILAECGILLLMSFVFAGIAAVVFHRRLVREFN